MPADQEQHADRDVQRAIRPEEASQTDLPVIIPAGLCAITFLATVYLLKHRPNAEDPNFQHLTPEDFQAMRSEYDYHTRDGMIKVALGMILVALTLAAKRTAQAKATHEERKAEEKSEQVTMLMIFIKNSERFIACKHLSDTFAY